MADLRISQLPPITGASMADTDQFVIARSSTVENFSVTRAEMFSSVSAISLTGDLTIADKIVHSGDTNTSIRFPAADTVTVETNGAERARITSAGNLLVGTSTDFTSTTAPGGLAVNGLGVYPSPQVSTTGTPSVNTTALSSLNVLGSFSTTGAATTTFDGIRSNPTLSNDGAGGNGQALVYGLRAIPQITSSGANARVFAAGVQAIVSRAYATDTSTNAGNIIIGGQFAAQHGTPLPNTTVTNQLFGAIGSAANNSGVATSMNSVRGQIFIGSTSTSQTTSSTEAVVFNASTFSVGAATSLGPATVTNGYGVKVSGPTVAATGTMTNYYGLHIGTPTVTGTLTNRYGIWVDDPASPNYFAGNVGIGTSSPSNFAGYTTLSLNNTTGSIVNLFVNGTETGRLQAYSGALALLTTNASTMLFMTNSSERMRITPTGDVGIGTTSPNKSGFTRALTVNTTGNFGLEFTRNDVVQTLLRQEGTGEFRISNSVSQPIHLETGGYIYASTGGAERLRLDVSGNLGIGTASPGFRLVVQDTANTRLRITDGTTTLDNLTSSSLGYVGTASSHPLVLMTALTERMRIDTSGNVGIGTSSPSATLTVDGTVGGTVIATQAEAEAGTSSTKLMTPQRVEQHMTANAIGWGQTWQNVTASRVNNTSYQNTTGKPIGVSLSLEGIANLEFQVSTNNSTWVRLGYRTGSSGDLFQAFFLIPDTHYYRIVNTSGTVDTWAELR